MKTTYEFSETDIKDALVSWLHHHEGVEIDGIKNSDVYLGRTEIDRPNDVVAYYAKVEVK